MNAIVFVVMPVPESQPLTERAAEPPVTGLVPAGARFPKTSKPAQTTPPFWTWFIENPRGVDRAAI
jgi:hypothetical protein